MFRLFISCDEIIVETREDIADGVGVVIEVTCTERLLRSFLRCLLS